MTLGAIPFPFPCALHVQTIKGTMEFSMRIEMIPNRYPANMGQEVGQSLRWAEQVDIASAYVSSGTLGRLESALEQSKAEKRSLTIRLLFGLYQRFTPPQALAKMLKLQRAYPGKFFVRIACNNRFHWKLYMFRRQTSRRLYVGSSNLTDDGLDASGELSVKITARANDAVVQAFENELESVWQREAFPLNKTILQNYRKVKRPPAFVTAPQKDDPISTLLRSAERPPLPPPSESNPRLVFIDDDVSDETDDIIQSEKRWQKKGWDYICYRYKSLYDSTRNAKVILLARYIDAKTCWLEFRRVVDAVEIETPDGKYFIAHSAIPHARSRRYNTVKPKLEEVGLTLKRIKSNRRLSEKQIEVLCRILHIKREKLDNDQ
jgi:HKD family nuclease